MKEDNLKLKKSKCELYASKIDVLGYHIDAAGIHPTESKITAIQELLSPKNKSELQSIIGLIAFYDRFLAHQATTFESLYRLMDNDAQWIWTEKHVEALQCIKDT